MKSCNNKNQNISLAKYGPVGKIVIAIIFVFCSGRSAFSQRVWFYELNFNLVKEQQINGNGKSYVQSPAYGYSLNINKGGKRLAVVFQYNHFSIKLDSLKLTNIKKHGLNEFYLGLRYYPIVPPTIRFGSKVAIRFTAGALLGIYNYKKMFYKVNDGISDRYYLSPMKVNYLLFGGFCFSKFYNLSGLNIKLNYRPKDYTMENFSLTQRYSLDIGFIIGPKVD